LFHNESEVN